MKDLLPVELINLAKRINRPIYVVGGAVRNFLLGFSINKSDIDICGDFDITALNGEGVLTSLINKRLGTCQVRIGNTAFEYTRFRREVYSGGKHVPDEVIFHGSIEDDARRRDFTCNSVYYDVLNEKIIDVVGGAQDIKNKVIRTTTDETFLSDGLRILRAVRFAAELGFNLHEDSERMLIQEAGLLTDISPERKRMELEKILHADKKYNILDAHYRGLKLMQKYKLFPFVIEEIARLEGVPQNPKYHLYDCLEHTFLTVKYARDDIRLAALMHDVGKPECLDSDGHMKGHNVVSERITRIALGQGRLNYPNKVIDETARLCYLHMYDLKGETSDAKMMFFVAENYDVIDKIAALREADGKATGMETHSKYNRFLYFRDLLISKGSPLSIKDLNIDGEVLNELNIQASKRSEILKELLHMCIIDPKLNTEGWLKSQLKKHSNIVN